MEFPTSGQPRRVLVIWDAEDYPLEFLDVVCSDEEFDKLRLCYNEYIGSPTTPLHIQTFLMEFFLGSDGWLSDKFIRYDTYIDNQYFELILTTGIY